MWYTPLSWPFPEDWCIMCISKTGKARSFKLGTSLQFTLIINSIN